MVNSIYVTIMDFFIVNLFDVEFILLPSHIQYVIAFNSNKHTIGYFIILFKPN